MHEMNSEELRLLHTLRDRLHHEATHGVPGPTLHKRIVALGAFCTLLEEGIIQVTDKGEISICETGR